MDGDHGLEALVADGQLAPNPMLVVLAIFQALQGLGVGCIIKLMLKLLLMYALHAPSGPCAPPARAWGWSMAGNTAASVGGGGAAAGVQPGQQQHEKAAAAAAAATAAEEAAAAREKHAWAHRACQHCARAQARRPRTAANAELCARAQHSCGLRNCVWRGEDDVCVATSVAGRVAARSPRTTARCCASAAPSAHWLAGSVRASLDLHAAWTTRRRPHAQCCDRCSFAHLRDHRWQLVAPTPCS